MKRVDLLRIQDEIELIINPLINQLRKSFLETEDLETKRAIGHVMNILLSDRIRTKFSITLKEVFRKQGVKIGLTDLDAVVVVNGKMKGLFEYKHRREDYERYFITNAFQFKTLRNLSIRTGIPLYYIVYLENGYYRVLEVSRYTKFDVRKLGKGWSEDHYAVVDLDQTVLLSELEFRNWLWEVLGR